MFSFFWWIFNWIKCFEAQIQDLIINISCSKQLSKFFLQFKHALRILYLSKSEVHEIIENLQHLYALIVLYKQCGSLLELEKDDINKML